GDQTLSARPPPGSRTVNTEPLPGSLATVTSPPHHARELAREGKAEPRSPVAARGERIGLGKILKQFRLLFGGQADAGIRDGKLDPVAAVRHLAHAQGDLALFRELTGIA